MGAVMSPLAWMFIAGWCCRSLLITRKESSETTKMLGNLVTLAAIGFCLWMGLR